MRKVFEFLIATFFVLSIYGCGEKYTELYNLTPDEWYAQIIQDIKDHDLETADKHYVSMASEHIASPMLEQILLILSQAHANDEEYLLANFYLDEYIKRYGDGADKTEFANFLKIKANFDSFNQPNRNQKLIQDSIDEIEKFLFLFPNTKYKPLIDTMLVKFKLALYHLNEQIADLYERTNRNTSAEIYKKKLENSALKDASLIKPELPWYRKIFE